MKKSILIIGLALMLGFASAQMNMGEMKSDDGSTMTMATTAELAKLRFRAYDIAYMSMMIEHHSSAVEMSKKILVSSKDTRIRNSAKAIIVAQSKEIGQLTSWLKKWYGVKPSKRYMNMMAEDMKGMSEGVSDNSETSPDRLFLLEMTTHHQEAIDMSQGCKLRANKPELKLFCAGVISDQSKEIEQFGLWLKNLP